MAKKSRSGTSAGTNHNMPKTGTEEAIPVHRRNGQLVDGLAAWQSEGAGTSSQIVRLFRLDENERLLIPFTTSMVRVVLHFLKSTAMNEFVHCLGEGCLLCQAGVAKELRDLFAAYDIMECEVGVLPVSPNVRANALRPQWQPILQRVAASSEPFLVTIRKSGMANFVVTTSSLPKGSDDGAIAIARFREKMDAGEVDLAAVYQRLDNTVIWDIPEIARLMAAKGIARCSSDPFAV